MRRRVALFGGELLTCIERIQAMLAEYMAAAWVLGEQATSVVILC
jgi:hypothetical protein